MIIVKEFTNDELVERACERVANVIKGHVYEGTGIHSRIFEVLVADHLVIVGRGRGKTNYREHVVPCSLIRDQCIKMYKDGATVKEVTSLIIKSLAIILISTEEANKLDKEAGLKTSMPKGWSFENINETNIFARLHEVGIEYTIDKK